MNQQISPASDFRKRIGVDIGRKMPLESAIDWAASRDVRFIDICLESDRTLLRDKQRLLAAGKSLKEKRITVGLHTLSAINTAETGPFVGEAVDAYLSEYISAAGSIGAKSIVVHAGLHFTSDHAARREASIERLKKASELAEKAGVVLLLENMNREPAEAEVHYLASDLEECRWYFERLRSPALRWTFTVNHAHQYSEGIEGFLDGLDFARCDEVRLADCRGAIEEHLPPGQGTIDFEAMFASIERRGYVGHYMQAFGTVDDMDGGRDTFTELAMKGLHGER